MGIEIKLVRNPKRLEGYPREYLNAMTIPTWFVFDSINEEERKFETLHEAYSYINNLLIEHDDLDLSEITLFKRQNTLYKLTKTIERDK
jgi:hypothetical protein